MTAVYRMQSVWDRILETRPMSFVASGASCVANLIVYSNGPILTQ